MKLHKRLTVDGAEVPIVAEHIRLDLDRPGVAVFTVRSEVPIEGRVEYSMGWSFSKGLTLYFTGEVEQSLALDEKQQKLVCPEFSARLDKAAPVSLRHPSLKEVLDAYAAQTGLSFILPGKAYAQTRIPAFYGFGSAFQAMATIGDVFHIEDYVWFTQADGRVFVGSWQDSRWKGIDLEIPLKMFSKPGADGSRTMTASPSIRPGAMLNAERVSSVLFSGHEAKIQFG